MFWGTQTPNKYFDISNTIEKKTDIKIYSGAAKPLKYKLVTAAHVHGKSGLDIKGSPIKIADNYIIQNSH